ncbi:MAG: hypothetical protein ACTSWY_11365 [Promethearchaeota archaeon]
MENQFNLAYKEGTNVSIFDNESFLRLDIKVADKKREYDVLNNAIYENILGKQLYIAPLEYVLLGKIIHMGKIDDIQETELLEYQDVIDFLTIFYANKEKVDETLLKTKVKELKLEKTLEILLKINFE